MASTKIEMQRAATAKAMEDSNFKKEILSSPHEALRSLGFEIETTADVTLEVVDQTDPNTIFINIPAAPIGGDMELTDAQLEVVAGGANSGGQNNGANCNDATVTVKKVEVHGNAGNIQL